jgi:hypothetical protein
VHLSERTGRQLGSISVYGSELRRGAQMRDCGGECLPHVVFKAQACMDEFIEVDPRFYA